MAEELKSFRPDLEIELVPSRGGRFEVSYAGNLVFSKLETHRFPEPGELLSLIAK